MQRSLIEQKLLNTPALFLSGEILKDRESYYSLLQTTRETDNFLPYLTWFVNLIYRASEQSIIRANKVRLAMQETKLDIKKANPSMYSQDLVNLLFKGPIIFAHHLLENNVARSTSTAHTYLKELENANILHRSKKRYGRKVGYVNTRLLSALSGEVDLS